MILPIVKYGHPTLRQRGARIERLTAEIEQFAKDMLETMYSAKGIGLAAQQVDRPLQMMVIDVREVTDRPSTMETGGKSVDVAAHMPMVLINPEIKPMGAACEGPEGCLSFPEIYSDVTRPDQVDVTAQNASGQTVQFRCSGLLSRAIQHEYDHLQGILFIDRMSLSNKDKIKPELDGLMAQTRAKLK